MFLSSVSSSLDKNIDRISMLVKKYTLDYFVPDVHLLSFSFPIIPPSEKLHASALWNFR